MDTITKEEYEDADVAMQALEALRSLFHAPRSGVITSEPDASLKLA